MPTREIHVKRLAGLHEVGHFSELIIFIGNWFLGESSKGDVVCMWVKETSPFSWPNKATKAPNPSSRDDWQCIQGDIRQKLLIQCLILLLFTPLMHTSGGSTTTYHRIKHKKRYTHAIATSDRICTLRSYSRGHHEHRCCSHDRYRKLTFHAEPRPPTPTGRRRSRAGRASCRRRSRRPTRSRTHQLDLQDPCKIKETISRRQAQD